MALRALHVLVAALLWVPSRPQYHAYTHLRINGKIRRMSSELVMDAEMKIAAIQHYRDQYYKSLQYQLGQMVYDMRNKFKKMVLLYQLVDRNVSYGYYDQYENTKTMIEVYHMSMEVENTIQMLHEWQRRREDKGQFHQRMQRVMRSGAEREHEHEHQHRQLAALRAPPDAPRRHINRWRYFRDVRFTNK